jgi:hypothetical protein
MICVEDSVFCGPLVAQLMGNLELMELCVSGGGLVDVEIGWIGLVVDCSGHSSGHDWC